MKQKTKFLTPGVVSAEFEIVKKYTPETIPVGKIDTLKDFQEKHQLIYFTPGIVYAWAHENQLDFDPLFSDLPDKYRKSINKLSLLPADIVDGFYGNQAFWNKTLWTIPSHLWVGFCQFVAGKAYFDTVRKNVAFFSLGLCQIEDILAKLKGKQQTGWITVAHIDAHFSDGSLVMSESIDTTMLSIARIKADPQIQAFAAKFFNADSSAVAELPRNNKQRQPVKEPVTAGFEDLTRSARKTFKELSKIYSTIIDNRESTPEE